MPAIMVAVTGPVGCGKSAIASEIEIALKAVGVSVTWEGGIAERNSVPIENLDPGSLVDLTVTIVELTTASIPDGQFGGPTLATSRDPE